MNSALLRAQRRARFWQVLGCIAEGATFGATYWLLCRALDMAAGVPR
jgi:hypothetical protein